jgi:hypothetical protein
MEMITVMALVMVGAAMAIPVTMSMVQNARGDSAMVATATFLESVRDRAVAERRNMQFSFPNNNTIVVERIEVPSGLLTEVNRLVLESGEEWNRAAGVINPPGSVGGGAINFTGVAPVMFTSDGSLIDSAGDVTNATIFIGKPGSIETQRAVAIWGVTGVLRSWKWSGGWRQ